MVIEIALYLLLFKSLEASVMYQAHTVTRTTSFMPSSQSLIFNYFQFRIKI